MKKIIVIICLVFSFFLMEHLYVWAVTATYKNVVDNEGNYLVDSNGDYVIATDARGYTQGVTFQ